MSHVLVLQGKIQKEKVWPKTEWLKLGSYVGAQIRIQEPNFWQPFLKVLASVL